MPPWGALLAATPRGRLAGTLLRLVESQEQVATLQLVGTLARQAILEDLLESTKPALRPGTGGLHYLLATPFRYPPLKHGSRFGTRAEPSLFYGARAVHTVLAEAAYYRFVFWAGMLTPPHGTVVTQHTLFGARYVTDRGLRLQAPPFEAYRHVLSSPRNYVASQTLGTLMREAGVAAFEYCSARDPHGGVNVAVFEAQALASKRPLSQTPWLCESSAREVSFKAGYEKTRHVFSLEVFQVDGALPHPA